MSLPERITRRLVTTPDGCWEWSGAKVAGYGRVSWNGGSRLVHRVVFALLVGDEVPELDHLCRNRACANPDHLEPVSHRENILRGVAAETRRSATHCKHGHARTPENSYVSPHGVRRCRTCIEAARQRYYERSRA